MRRLLRARPSALNRGLEVVAARGTSTGKVCALGALWGLDHAAMLGALAPVGGWWWRRAGMRPATVVAHDVVVGGIWLRLQRR